MQTTTSKSIDQRTSEYLNLLAETMARYENEEISFKEATLINKKAALEWKEIQALGKQGKMKMNKSRNDMAISFDQLYDRTF